MFSQLKKIHNFKACDIPFTSVTVFNDGADIRRTLKVKLESGLNEVIIENMTKDIVAKSMRIEGRGEAIIHNIQFCEKSSKLQQNSSEKVDEHEEESKKIRLEKEAVEDEQKVWKRLLAILEEIAVRVGSAMSHQRDSKEEISSLAFNDESLRNVAKFFNFYETNCMDTYQKLREANEKIRILDEKLKKLNPEDSSKQKCEKSSRNISVLLESIKEELVEIDICYQVKSANWYPTYEIRFDSDSTQGNTMKLNYYGKIEQNTGEDWIDAPLVISTARPSIDGTIPKLGTKIAFLSQPSQSTFGVTNSLKPGPKGGIFGNATSPNVFGSATNSGAFSSTTSSSGGNNQSFFHNSSGSYEDCLQRVAPPLVFGLTKVAPAIAGDTVVSTVFKIERPATIPSDSGEHRVMITSINMQPTMHHETIPSKSSNVFLSASVLNSSLFPLIAGEASIYLNNSFIAKSDLKAVSPNERFIFSLGIDHAVKVDYKPALEFSEQVGTIAKWSSITHEQKIIIKNTKDERILLTVNEHVPKTNDEKIKINLISPVLDAEAAEGAESHCNADTPPPGARLNSAHNLEWTVEVGPHQESELLVKWSVEYPIEATVKFREQF
uniref:DUF4139 domain-containing protein n=1 Tax=Ascaris lumbricoides TaxID=6252 RepID=A0A0M3IAU4_ASCLU